MAKAATPPVSITAHEWPAIRARFQAWLAPENVDAHGHQQTRLGHNPARVPPLAT